MLVILAVALLVIDRDALLRVGLLGRGEHALATGRIDAGGLLHEDVLARRHRGFEMLGMQIGRRGDVDGIHVAGQQFVHVLELAGAGELLGGGLQLIVVDVADRGDARVLVPREDAADGGAAAAAADQAHRQRGIGLRAAHGLRLQDREAERRGGAAPILSRNHGELYSSLIMSFPIRYVRIY